MKKNRTAQEVNAGSMADIAFLLLIFFLVTASIEYDSGLNRLMPPENKESEVNIKKRNLLEIQMNDHDEILAKGEIIPIQHLKDVIISFIDNGGQLLLEEGYCDYCKGARLKDLSENPSKAIVSISASRNTSYPTYIAVQDEVMASYNFLRNREGLRLFNTTYEAINTQYNNQEITDEEKKGLKEKLETLRTFYPQKILEPETMNN